MNWYSSTHHFNKTAILRLQASTKTHYFQSTNIVIKRQLWTSKWIKFYCIKSACLRLLWPSTGAKSHEMSPLSVCINVDTCLIKTSVLTKCFLEDIDVLLLLNNLPYKRNTEVYYNNPDISSWWVTEIVT